MEDLNKKEEKIIEEGIRYAKKKALLARLKGLEEDASDEGIELPSKKIIFKLWQKWSIAASIFLLIALSWMIFGDSHYETIFKTKFDLYRSGKAIRSVQSPDLETLAYNAYEQRKYSTAVPLFEDLIGSGSHEQIDSFYLGIAYLGSNQLEKAEQTLTKFRKTSKVLNNQAAWYLALTYLRQEDTDSIEELIEKLEEEEKEKRIEISENKKIKNLLETIQEQIN